MNSSFARIHGLVAATHTPFKADLSLDIDRVDRQAEHFLSNNIHHVFICGTTGECPSLTLEERKAMTQRWTDVASGTALKVIVHVGSTCLETAMDLARHAREKGAAGIAAFAPHYFKPANVQALTHWCGSIARNAPDLPYYFYDIPSLTGVSLSMADLLQGIREPIPNFAGIKYTNDDLTMIQRLLHEFDGAFDILWGRDETLLAGLALGIQGAVGSTYNFSAPTAHAIVEAFNRSDLETARREQFRLVRQIRILDAHGYMPAAKAFMGLLGVEVGPPRPPLSPLPADAVSLIRQNMEEGGFLG